MLREKTGPHHRPCFNHADFRRPSPHFCFPRLLFFGTVPLKINVVSNLVASYCSRCSVPYHRCHPMFPGYMGGIGGGHLLVGRLPQSRRAAAQPWLVASFLPSSGPAWTLASLVYSRCDVHCNETAGSHR